MMHYYNVTSRRLEGKDTIAIATSGKFGLAAKLIIPEAEKWFLSKGVEVPDISLELYMSKKFEEENSHMTKRLEGNRTRIVSCSTGWCPSVEAERGQEVAFVREVENYFPNYRAYPQHEDPLNLLAYLVGFSPEIFYQTNGKVTHYIVGNGTCGSLIGGGSGLKRLNPEISVVGLVPQEGHLQLGLRSRNELGASRFFPYAEKLSDEVKEISNEDSWSNMEKLWGVEIPSGMTGGTYIWGALEVARKLYENGKEGIIVTLIPDSCEDYENFYEKYFPRFLKKKFDKDLFDNLSAIAKKEREKHINSLRNNSVPIFGCVEEHWKKYQSVCDKNDFI